MASGPFTKLGKPTPPGQGAYERYAKALRHYLVRRVRRPEDVEDLTQEVFALFVRRKDQAQLIRNPLAYLFRIAFHVVGTALADEERSTVTLDLQGGTAEAQMEAHASTSEEAEE